ncbi:hypothetical protein CDAR_19441 [Caerostris darwini]|uniref:Gustatory receptor n=1 Tax=Caerostris darwini TaxID=1538125 RepID=A0AAV4WDX8_9ARAC|nr:hypothetical protein CDAR_19441 [Caerostris darwini]
MVKKQKYIPRQKKKEETLRKKLKRKVMLSGKYALVFRIIIVVGACIIFYSFGVFVYKGEMSELEKWCLYALTACLWIFTLIYTYLGLKLWWKAPEPEPVEKEE